MHDRRVFACIKSSKYQKIPTLERTKPTSTGGVILCPMAHDNIRWARITRPVTRATPEDS